MIKTNVNVELDTPALRCEHGGVKRAQIANVLTSSRLVLAPIFAIVFGLTSRVDGFATAGISILWAIFIIIEITDVLDGAIARRSNTVSDIGKVLDPFADVISKVTYFACLLTSGLVPLWFLLIVLYREFGITLVRMILFREQIALAAHWSGKLKTWFYGVTAAVGLVFYSIGALGQEADAILGFATRPVGGPDALWTAPILLALLVITAALSAGSFLRYLVVFGRLRRKGSS